MFLFLCPFSRLQWGFTSHRAYSDSEALVVSRLCRHYQAVSSSKETMVDPLSTSIPPPQPAPNTYTLTTLQIDSKGTPPSATGFPHLQIHSISSLKELKPLFDALLYQNRSIATNHHHHHHHYSSLNSKSSLPLAAAAGLGLSSQVEARLAAVENLLLCDFMEPLS